MKKFITIVSLSFLFIMVCLLTASSQQGKGKGNSKEKGQHANGKMNADQGKAHQNVDMQKPNHGNNDNAQKQKGKELRSEKGHKPMIGKGNSDHGNGKGNGGNNAKNDREDKNIRMDKINGKKDKNYYNSVYGYDWNKESFKERRKLKKQDKVSICHKFSGDDGVNISVSENAVKAHLNHGDILGDCPTYNDRRYSNKFYDSRKSYYNNLQNTQEQVVYSQSILDYALARLTNSRSQLQVMQNNRLPAADLQRKQESVVQLEQNVSLLETLIGVAASVVANQL